MRGKSNGKGEKVMAKGSDNKGERIIAKGRVQWHRGKSDDKGRKRTPWPRERKNDGQGKKREIWQRGESDGRGDISSIKGK